MILYFDTSALIKLVVSEDGSDTAAQLWMSTDQPASSVLSYPEGRAALAAARRSGRLTRAGYTTALEDFHSTQAELTIVGIDQLLAREAGALAADLALRSYDAVHLATALALGADSTILVTWDRALSDAAGHSGLGVAPAL